MLSLLVKIAFAVICTGHLSMAKVRVQLINTGGKLEDREFDHRDGQIGDATDFVDAHSANKDIVIILADGPVLGQEKYTVDEYLFEMHKQTFSNGFPVRLVAASFYDAVRDSKKKTPLPISASIEMDDLCIFERFVKELNLLTLQVGDDFLPKVAVVSAPSTIDGVEYYKRPIPKVLMDYHYDLYRKAMKGLFSYHYFVLFEMLWRLALKKKPSEVVIVTPCDVGKPAAAPRQSPAAEQGGKGDARQGRSGDRGRQGRGGSGKNGY